MGAGFCLLYQGSLYGGLRVFKKGYFNFTMFPFLDDYETGEGPLVNFLQSCENTTCIRSRQFKTLSYLAMV